jgi:hypothetical protein
MTTRYSLPRDVKEADAARGARTLAALALVVTVIALSLLAVVLPGAEPGVAAVPDGDVAPAPVVAGA